MSEAFPKKLLRSIPFIFLVVLAACGGTSSPKGGGSVQARLKSIQVGASSLSILVNTTEPFTATGTFSDGTPRDITSSVTWSSSVSTVATVATDGTVAAKGVGSTTITATDGAVTGSAALKVNPTLVSLAITPGTVSIAPQTTQSFKAPGP